MQTAPNYALNKTILFSNLFSMFNFAFRNPYSSIHRRGDKPEKNILKSQSTYCIVLPLFGVIGAPR